MSWGLSGLLSSFGPKTLEELAKNVIKAHADEVFKGVREKLAHMGPVDNDKLKQLVIDQFDHNRHLPGEVRKWAKKEVLDFDFTTVDKRLKELQDAVDKW